jgi:hypothetical protein
MRKLPPLVTLAAIAVATTLAHDAGRQSGPGVANAVVTGASGYRAVIDPATGRLAETDASKSTTALPADLVNALRTDSEGLVERKSPVEGGGFYVNLEGRFQSSMVAGIDENGRLTTECLSGDLSAAEDVLSGGDDDE